MLIHGISNEPATIASEALGLGSTLVSKLPFYSISRPWATLASRVQFGSYR